jgi:hypothetical protein
MSTKRLALTWLLLIALVAIAQTIAAQELTIPSHTEAGEQLQLPAVSGDIVI